MGRMADRQTHTCSMVISQGYVFPLEEEKEARIDTNQLVANHVSG
jgi:hypothetical protein